MFYNFFVISYFVDDYDFVIDYFIYMLGFMLSEDKLMGKDSCFVLVMFRGSSVSILLMCVLNEEECVFIGK